MARPWEVSADDIVAWASTALAPATLPKLIRRLLFATTPLRSLAMRADAGIRLAGWDGVVESFRNTEFCPEGLSFWELSVEAAVKSKLDRDFQKRIEERTTNPSATYVAVTARRFPEPSRGKWLQEKQRLRVFRGVAVLDADDLATWIERSPPVARWFAQLLGKPAAGAEDLETFLALWANRTAPPLPAELALAGREREASAARVRTWLSAAAPRSLAIRGDTREEALVFTAAAMNSAALPEAEFWRSRALVVRDLETWRWLLGAQHAEPPILLPAFSEIDRGHVEQAAKSLKAHVILPLDASTPVEIEAEVLEPISYAQIAEKLRSAGVVAAEAERLARESGGRLAALQRLLGHVVTPDWLVAVDLPTLLVMLLAGAWNPTSDADREVIGRLGVDPQQVEELCTRLSRRPDAPIARETSWGRQGHWRWVAPGDAWKALARSLSDSNLTSFLDVSIEVLSERDPRYEMPKDERFYAAAYGKVLGCSPALRAGLAESLVRLALSDPELRATLQTSRGSVIAEVVVSRILDIELGWQAWASLSDLLPILAEAAPSVFLSQVERSLDRGEDGVSHLLLEEGDFGASPHTGLLWALEILGWNQEFVARVANALARLALRDPPGVKMANRPAGSLGNLLHPLIPQSQSSAEERVQILSVLLERRELYGDVGWSVALKQFVGGPGIMFPSRRPEYRAWGAPVDRRDASHEERRVQLAKTLELLLQYVDSESARWNALLQVLWRLAPTVSSQILDRLGEIMSVDQDVNGMVWASLRKLAAEGHQFGDAWNISPELLQRVVQLYQRFTPVDEIAQISWLFDNQAQVPEPLKDWQAQRDRKLELQQIAVAKLWKAEGRWELLARLTAVAVEQYQVGAVLGTITDPELDRRLLESARDEHLASLLPAFVWSRAQTLGMGWAIETIKKLADGGRRNDALAVALVRSESSELWDAADSMGEPFKSEFWSKAGLLIGPYSASDADRALQNLLHAENVITAAELASYRQEVIAPARALEILQALRRLDEQRLKNLRAGGAVYAIEQIFSITDRDPALDMNEIVALEIYFFPLLENSPRKARHLFTALSQDPELFTSLIVALYKPEPSMSGGASVDEGDSSAASSETDPGELGRRQRRVEIAYAILAGWQGVPGADLAGDDREDALLSWTLTALRLSAEQGRKTASEREVARVLARAPGAPDDGLWPCKAARVLLESGRHSELEDGLFIAKGNLRGATSRAIGEGGGQERALAVGFRADAKKLRIQWPRTAALLDKLGRRYEREAEREDEEASSERRQWSGRTSGDAVDGDIAAAPLAQQPVTFDRIEVLSLVGVGPAPSLTVKLAPRLTLLTGQNSAGKTFILDVLWWGLTGTWADLFAWPTRDAQEGLEPTIGIGLPGKESIACRYSAAEEAWSRPAELGSIQALVVYCRVDGGFTVWDPVRGRETGSGNWNGKLRSLDRMPFRFRPDELWGDGLKTEDGVVLCNGIIHDVVDWKARRSELSELLDRVLGALSDPDEPMRLAAPQRLSIRDARDFPTLKMPYGDIPIVHASAAVKRIFGLAYLLVWAWHEHRAAARLAGVEPVSQMVVLFDEPEAHLHPIWQRRVLPALFEAVRALGEAIPVQVVASTHSPLVTASLEPVFDLERDKLLHFQVDDADRAAKVHEIPWAKQGDASDWLVSEAFGLKSARSAEAEQAIIAAMDFVKGEAQPDPKAKAVITQQLRSVLPGDDPFLVRWVTELPPQKDQG